MGAPYVEGRAWEDELYEVVSAGRDSGKSVGGALRHLLFVKANPGSVNIIAAPDYTRLERATMPALFDVLRRNGIIQGRDYDYNQTKRAITWLWDGYAGTTTLFASLDNPDSVRGIRAASIWIDETRDVSWNAFLAILPTLTQPKMPHHMWMTTTPAPGKDHWLYGLFFPVEAYEEGYSDRKPADDTTVSWLLEDRRHLTTIGGKRFICTFAETWENPHGGREAWEQMKRIYGEDSPIFQTEARGRFAIWENLTYPMWRTDYHAKHRAEWPPETWKGATAPLSNPLMTRAELDVEARTLWRPDNVLLGVDFGTVHKAAITVIAVDYAGRVFILDEWARAGSSPPELAREAVRLAKLWGASFAFSDHDPAWRWPLRDALAEIGVVCHRANKMVGSKADPSGGIGLIGFLLNDKMPDGSQRWYLDRDRCPQLIKELENYQRISEKDGRPSPEKPLKVGDDGADATRYGVQGAQTLHWLEVEAIGGAKMRRGFQMSMVGA